MLQKGLVSWLSLPQWRGRHSSAESHATVMRAAFAPFRTRYTGAAYDATILDARRIRRRMHEGPVWVIDAGGRVVATISSSPTEDGVYVRGLGVRPDARGNGAGRCLLEAAEAHALAIGTHRMWLSTTPFLQASIALYQSCGFVPCDGPNDLHGIRLLNFEKRLGQPGRKA